MLRVVECLATQRSSETTGYVWRSYVCIVFRRSRRCIQQLKLDNVSNNRSYLQRMGITGEGDENCKLGQRSFDDSAKTTAKQTDQSYTRSSPHEQPVLFSALRIKSHYTESCTISQLARSSPALVRPRPRPSNPQWLQSQTTRSKLFETPYISWNRGCSNWKPS